MRSKLPFDAFDLSDDEVRSRFDWAVRQGQPMWLWPDVTFEAWRTALEQIERVTRQVLGEGRANHSLSGDEDAVGIAAFTSGMGPLLGHWLSAGLLDADAKVAAVLELQLRHNSERMERMAEHAVAAVLAIAERGVKVTVLKGMQTSYACFPVPGARPLSDIDLLIDPADRDLAGAALRSLGYLPGRAISLPPQQCWRVSGTPAWPRSLALLHADNGWYIDLQTSLSRRYSAGAPMIRLDEIMHPETIEPWALAPQASALSPVAQALHVACHAGCGLENLMMLRLTELVLVVRQGEKDGRFCWDRFVDLAERSGALASAYPALYLSDLLVPDVVPRAVLQLGAAQIPDSVRRVMARLTPASAQRVMRCSLEERYMWTSSSWNRVRQTVVDLFPLDIAWRELLGIYKMRMWRLVRGTITKRAPSGF